MRPTFNVPGMFGEFRTSTRTAKSNTSISIWRHDDRILPGVVLPVRPFPGTMAVAAGSSALFQCAARRVCGNMDIRDLRGRDNLYVPVSCRAPCYRARFARRPGQRRSTTTRAPKPRSRSESSPSRSSRHAAGLSSDRDTEVLDHHGIRPGPHLAWAQAKVQTIKLLTQKRGIRPPRPRA